MELLTFILAFLFGYKQDVQPVIIESAPITVTATTTPISPTLKKTTFTITKKTKPKIETVIPVTLTDSTSTIPATNVLPPVETSPIVQYNIEVTEPIKQTSMDIPEKYVISEPTVNCIDSKTVVHFEVTDNPARFTVRASSTEFSDNGQVGKMQANQTGILPVLDFYFMENSFGTLDYQATAQDDSGQILSSKTGTYTVNLCK